ncbi:MAG: saccharopine dehydrogenase NADP-binding domain-containing protein [Elusimicrobia bacterium]|nr:saccharopine dehydrogenase NADP-binding domain-containing protein [Elusimicrobiota bacterium]
MAEAALFDLARSNSVSEILAADREIGRAKAVLSRIPGRRKIRVVALDATDTAAAARQLAGARVVVNCAWYELNLKAMDLALALKAHYVDLGGLFHMTLKQRRREPELRKAGLLAVLGCGSTPGITNMMVARMAGDFDRIDTVGIYDASHDPTQTSDSFLPPFSIRTMLDEYVMPAPVWRGGRLTEVQAHSEPETLDFPAPIGRCVAGTVIHSEVATLPGYLKAKGVKNLSFKIVYPETVKRQLAMLVAMGLDQDAPMQVNGHAVSPRRFLTALAQRSALGIGASAPGDFEVVRVRITGRAQGSALTRELDVEMRPCGPISAGAAGVGFTAAIAAQMLAASQVQRRSGVLAPESALQIAPFFQHLAARKVFRLVERMERHGGPIGWRERQPDPRAVRARRTSPR